MVDVPGQQYTVTMCAAISKNGVVTHISSLGPYNTQKLLILLDRLYSDLIPENERGLVGPHPPNYIILWDNVNFHTHQGLVHYSSMVMVIPTTFLSFPQSYWGVYLMESAICDVKPWRLLLPWNNFFLLLLLFSFIHNCIPLARQKTSTVTTVSEGQKGGHER